MTEWAQTIQKNEELDIWGEMRDSFDYPTKTEGVIAVSVAVPAMPPSRPGMEAAILNIVEQYSPERKARLIEGLSRSVSKDKASSPPLIEGLSRSASNQASTAIPASSKESGSSL